MSQEHIEKLKKILKYQVEGYGGKINPKDDFVGFVNDILSWKRKYFPKDTYPSPNIKEILEVYEEWVKNIARVKMSHAHKCEAFNSMWNAIRIVGERFKGE